MTAGKGPVQAVIDANPYMTLATADEHGSPWVSPVWFATVDYREFIWVSAAEKRHSRNIAARPEVAIVIFDSQQRPFTSEAVYFSAHAEQVPEPDLDRCLEIFSAASERQGLPIWSRDKVEPPARMRLYHATASEHFMLSSTEERVRVDLM